MKIGRQNNKMNYNGQKNQETDIYFLYNKLKEDIRAEMSMLMEIEKHEIDKYFNKKVEELEYRINEMISSIAPTIKKAELERQIHEEIKKIFK